MGLDHHPLSVFLQIWACVLPLGHVGLSPWELGVQTGISRPCAGFTWTRACRAPWDVTVSCYLGLVCGSVFEGMGFCDQPRTLKQSFSFVELLRAEVNLCVSSSFPVCLFSLSPHPLPAPLHALPLPSNSSLFNLAWPSIYCVAQAALTFSVLQLMSTGVIDMRHW